VASYQKVGLGFPEFTQFFSAHSYAGLRLHQHVLLCDNSRTIKRIYLTLNSHDSKLLLIHLEKQQNLYDVYPSGENQELLLRVYNHKYDTLHQGTQQP